MSVLDSTAPATRRGGALGAAARRVWSDRARYVGPLVVAVALLVVLVVNIWWALEDARLPDGDNGKHLTIAFGYYDLIDAGAWKRLFTDYNQYPPFIHFVGAIGALFAGPSTSTALIAENVFFLPLRAIGCYGAGTVAFGRAAGTLAALFALAVPMVLGLFHVFMLDAPTAGVAAATVWALLASERFGRTRIAALAGLAAGAGLLSKGTFVMFIAGLVAVMLLRGGWRNWRGFLAFAAVAGVIAVPYYVYHLGTIGAQTEGAVVGKQPNWYGNVPYPERFSFENFTWYGWNLINNQLYLPLTLFFVIGLLYLGFRWARHRRPDSYFPELLAGGVVAYVGISFITLDDPRYTLPALVYWAVIGTAWVGRLPKIPRLALGAVLVGVLAFNLQNINFADPGARKVIRLKGYIESPIGERILTLYSPGYGQSAPDPEGAAPVLKLLERAHADGARKVVFDPASLNSGGYNLNGLVVLARGAGLNVLGFTQAEVDKKDEIFVWRQLATQVDSPACLMSPAVADGTAFFMRWGPERPRPDIRCPRRG